MTAENKPVRAVQTSIRIVKTLRDLGSAGVTEIADRLDIPTSTTYDHLRTLEQNEFVRKSGDQYLLASRFLEIGGYCRKENRLYNVANPEIEKLAHQTGEHANLMIEEFGRGVFYAISKGQDAFELDTHIGKRVHLQTTSGGKAILAGLPDEQVREIIDTHGLPAITENTVTDRDVLFDEIESIRDQGYALDKGERIPGVRCVGAAITDDDDEAIAAVTVSGPESGMQDERFSEELPEMVMRTANIIEVNMKYQ